MCQLDTLLCRYLLYSLRDYNGSTLLFTPSLRCIIIINIIIIITFSFPLHCRVRASYALINNNYKLGQIKKHSFFCKKNRATAEVLWLCNGRTAGGFWWARFLTVSSALRPICPVSTWGQPSSSPGCIPSRECRTGKIYFHQLYKCTKCNHVDFNCHHHYYLLCTILCCTV